MAGLFSCSTVSSVYTALKLYPDDVASGSVCGCALYRVVTIAQQSVIIGTCQ